MSCLPATTVARILDEVYAEATLVVPLIVAETFAARCATTYIFCFEGFTDVTVEEAVPY